jgi:localization factor PodJL
MVAASFTTLRVINTGAFLIDTTKTQVILVACAGASVRLSAGCDEGYMSGAQSWSVKGIDPKVREAAREAAARQGMTLGEYLSHALQNHPPPRQTPQPEQQTQRFRAPRLAAHPYDEEEDDWHISGPVQSHRNADSTARITDPVRLAQRIDSIERRTQLAVTGLDRAVSTIDRSVLGLAARIEDAESIAHESADRISEALEQFRLAGDTLGGRLESAEREVAESREALGGAKTELMIARERLESQVAAAEDIARKAEAAAAFLSTEMANREAALGHRLGALEDQTRESFSAALVQARTDAENAARDALRAASDALTELRQLRSGLTEQVEHTARQAIAGAVEQIRSESQGLLSGARAQQENLAERLHKAENETRALRTSVVEEVVRLESEIGARIGAADTLKAEHAALIARIERAELGARETTAGLRQAAGAAIADLRNAQLGLAARLKQVEETSGRSEAIDLADMRGQQAEIAARLASLEARTSPVNGALAAFERRLDEISQRVEQNTAAPESPVNEALASFERRIQEIAGRVDQSVPQERLDEVGGQVRTLDQSMQRLAERIAETESTANNAIRTLEETVSSLSARVEGASATQETEALRALLESRLDEMSQSVTSMVGEARTELADQVQAALNGHETLALESALGDTNLRLAAAERRQAQTIEAISIEIKRMSETVDRRLRAVETRDEDGAASGAVREELNRMAKALEARFEEIERREAAAFDRMGLEVGRLSERLEDRVGAVEGRSAQAIEQVGEQVARMAERFNQRHEVLARDLGERMLDSEERSGARVSEAISSMMQRLGEVEERSAEAVAPVQKAMSNIASRLEGLQHDKDEDFSTPSRRADDYSSMTPFASTPMQSAQPLRAGPLPPSTSYTPTAPKFEDSDIYFADDIDIVAEEAPVVSAPAPLATFTESTPYIAIEGGGDDEEAFDAFLEDADAFAPPPPEDDDPFWTPDAEPTTSASPLPEPGVFADEAPLDLAPEEALAFTDPEPAPPAGKNDYLAAARRAAQAQATPAKARKEQQNPNDTPTYSLRGSSRVVLWGAASAIALLIAGGAWYLNQQEAASRAPAPTQPEPDVTTPTEALAPPAESYDPSIASPAEGAAEVSPGAPIATPPESPPIASAAPRTNVAQATPARPGAAPVTAAPLAPRNVSLEAAARGGDLVAQYEFGLQRIAAGRTEEGVAMLRRSADRGMAMAQYRLAKLYERGEGVTADLTLARQWTERAAAGGNRRAMHDLGVYFARGEGAPLDEAAAFRWFRQAAELGVADSQYNLGVLYQQGRGVGASPSEAMFWFLVAARQGDEDAGARATALEATLQPIQVEQARARATAFRPRAASAPANGEFGARPWNNAPARPAA